MHRISIALFPAVLVSAALICSECSQILMEKYLRHSF